ncbi:hypothetical protein SISSUDRAFT_1058740 [Sistotremastrum suecicum HHB10207 ss-3]|uniref:DHH phosphoesterase n=1 Tax=Sistotremastrum suecicum HHB10207 ss-3 TaxID=1314776 RepID=A0A166H6C3_9AGAM|nr:hypothetical protein SISSUDRAFT_1058740 [Sistotremastrum suecicum HHB10207 ss-3]
MSSRTLRFTLSKASSSRLRRGPQSFSYSSAHTPVGTEWPVSKHQLDKARNWFEKIAQSNGRIVFAPNTSADALCSFVIFLRTLELMGYDMTRTSLYHKPRASSIYAPEEREKVASLNPDYIISIDSGLPEDDVPCIVPGVPTLLVEGMGLERGRETHFGDHQESEESFQILSPPLSSPPATCSLTAFLLCQPLHPDVHRTCKYIASIGAACSLGTNVSKKQPYTAYSAILHDVPSRELIRIKSLLYAPARVEGFGGAVIVDALRGSSSFEDILDPLSSTAKKLYDAQRIFQQTLDGFKRLPFRYSLDGKLAMLCIHSPSSVHATLARELALSFPIKSKVDHFIVANAGYKSGTVSFSCRTTRTAFRRQQSIQDKLSTSSQIPLNDAQTMLRQFSKQVPGLVKDGGYYYNKGLPHATGGSLSIEMFEKLRRTMSFVGDLEWHTGMSLEKPI